MPKAPAGPITPSGTAYFNLGPLVTTATGTVSGGGGPVTGTGAITLGPLTTAATGTIPGSGPPVAGYLAWYDASQIAQADNTPVASWPDLSGNGHTLTQSTPANQPTFYSSTVGKPVNGRPAVWFDDTKPTWMQAAAFGSPIAQPGTVFVVAQQTAALPTDATLFDGNADRWNLSAEAASARFFIYAGTLLYGASFDANLHCFSVVFNSGSSYLFVDSGQTGPASAGAFTLDQIFIGAAGPSPTTAYGWTGPICEIIYYNFGLSGPQVTSVQSYLKTKWGTP